MGTNAEQCTSRGCISSLVCRRSGFLKEAPAHEVYLPDYYIARTPITNQLWAEYANRTSSLTPPTLGLDSPPIVPSTLSRG